MPEFVAEPPDVGVVDAAPDADLDGALGIEQTLLDRARERRAVMVVGAEIVGAGIAMGVDVHHANRAQGGDRAQDRQRDRMVAAGGQRHDPGLVDLAIEGGDLGEPALEVERPLHPGVAEVGDPAELVGRDPARLVDLAHQRRLVADLARAVARAGAVGHAAVERHADQPDVDVRQILAIGRAHERRKPGVARPRHRIVELGRHGHRGLRLWLRSPLGRAWRPVRPDQPACRLDQVFGRPPSSDTGARPSRWSAGASGEDLRDPRARTEQGTRSARVSRRCSMRALSSSPPRFESV